MLRRTLAGRLPSARSQESGSTSSRNFAKVHERSDRHDVLVGANWRVIPLATVLKEENRAWMRPSAARAG